MSEEFHYLTAGADRISHEEGDETAWVCLCGNTPHTDGFSPCDMKGQGNYGDGGNNPEILPSI